MRLLSLGSLLLLVGLAACNKSTDIPAKTPANTAANTTASTAANTAAKFSLSGPQALVFVDSVRPQTFTYTYQVNADAGVQDSVRLTLGNLPAGMRGVLSQTAGVPPFTTQLSLTVDSLVLGNYSFSITGQSPDSAHALAVSADVQADGNAAMRLAGGGYQRTSTGDGIVSPNTPNAIILSDPTDNTHLRFPKLYSSYYGDDTADAYLDFANHTFRITSHYPDYWSYKTGHGTYTITPSEIKFTFTSSMSVECGSARDYTTYQKSR